MTLKEKIVAITKKRYGPEAHDTILAMSNLASGLERAGRYDQALPLFERTLDLATKVLGANQRSTLTLMNNYGLCCSEGGAQRELLLEIFEKLFAIRNDTLGPDHLATIATMNNLALAYRLTGQQQRAVPLHEEVLSRSRRKFGLDHPVTLTRMGNLAESYRQTGRVDQSVPLFEEANALLKATLGPDHLFTLKSERDVARVYQDLGRLDEAHVLIKDAADRANSTLGRKHRDTLNALCDLADSYLLLGRLDEALEVARGFPDRDDPKTARPSVERADAETVLGRIQLARKAWTEAEAPLKNALAIREITAPKDWATFNTRSLLGAALLGQKKYADAEPLLRAGYEGLKARAETLSPARKHNLCDALDRLIELAQATGKADEAKAWKDERAKSETTAAPKPGHEKK